MINIIILIQLFNNIIYFNSIFILIYRSMQLLYVSVIYEYMYMYRLRTMRVLPNTCV